MRDLTSHLTRQCRIQPEDPYFPPENYQNINENRYTEGLDSRFGSNPWDDRRSSHWGQVRSDKRFLESSDRRVGIRDHWYGTGQSGPPLDRYGDYTDRLDYRGEQDHYENRIRNRGSGRPEYGYREQVADPWGHEDYRGRPEGWSRSGLPIARWKILYSGDAPMKPNEVDIHDFLDLCRMFSRSENVSERALLQQVVHLLTDRARSWFQNVYHEIYTWGQFEKMLKEKFLPDDYNYWLLSEIENRKQSRGEAVGIYINDMIMKYRALPLPVPEQQKVYTVRRNLLPHFVNCLAPIKMSTLSELEEVCKRVESSQPLGRIKPPEPPIFPKVPYVRTTPRAPRYVNELEYEEECCGEEYDSESDREESRDLMAVKNNSNKKKREKRRFKRPHAKEAPKKAPTPELREDREVPPIDCYNCGQVGHGFNEFTVPRDGKVFCYRCGKPDVRTADPHSCPKNEPRCSDKTEQPSPK